MSFSWWCEDKAGKDLFDEFKIHGQALGLGEEDGAPRLVAEIRACWISVPYKNDYQPAACDAVMAVKEMVRENLAYFCGPEHAECPHCQCRRAPGGFIGFDIEQAKRFLEIPIERVWRAGGGY
jgi:hypothetical protein